LGLYTDPARGVLCSPDPLAAVIKGTTSRRGGKGTIEKGKERGRKEREARGKGKGGKGKRGR